MITTIRFTKFIVLFKFVRQIFRIKLQSKERLKTEISLLSLPRTPMSVCLPA